MASFCLPAFQKPLDILPSRLEQPFHVHLAQTSQPKPCPLVPLLDFPKQRFDPHQALAQGFLIRGRLVIGLHPIDILLKEGTEYVTPAPTPGAVRFDGALITNRRRSAVDQDLFPLASRVEG